MSNKPVGPLTSEENKDLSDIALISAMSKLNTLSAVTGFLRSAIEELNCYTRTWSSYSNDPYFLKLKEEVQSLYFSIPDSNYFDRVFEAISGTPTEAYDATGYDYDLRHRDAGISIDHNEDSVDRDLPWEDPLDMFIRKRDV